MRIPALALAFALSLATAPSTRSLADSTAEDPDVDGRLETEEAKLELLNDKLQTLEGELAELDTKKTTLLGELQRLDIQVRVAQQQLELHKLQLQRGYRAIDDNLERIQLLEGLIAELKPYLQKRSISLYKLGRLSYVRLLLSVEQPSELTRSYRYISRLAREDGKKMQQFLDSQVALEETKSELLKQTEQTLATREQLEATTRTLASRRSSRTALLEEVSGRQEMAKTLVYELERAREDLGALVDSLVAGEPVPFDTVQLPMKMFEGEIGWPVEGELVGRFGTQLHPRFKTVTVRNGIEVEAPAGTAIHAVYDGEVVFASWFQGYGKLLIMEHPGGVHSLYGYLSDFDVSAGDRISQGETVAFVGDTGSLSGPRLYFEIRVDGQPADPEGWLDPSQELVLAAAN